MCRLVVWDVQSNSCLAASFSLQVIIYITMLLFAFKVYSSGLYPIGSIEKVWQNLNRMAEPDAVPVAGKQQLIIHPPRHCTYPIKVVKSDCLLQSRIHI